jgi:predicted O-linked N-acetylglucosamine transferase (SPINDLY family)
MNPPNGASARLRDLVDRARVHLDKRQFNDAAALLIQALEITPDNPDLCFTTANALRQTEDYAQAAEFYRRATRLRPDFFAAFCNLGASLKILGCYREAAEALDAACRLHPDSVDAALQCADLNMRLNLVHSAEKALSATLAHHPDSAPLLNGLGNCAMVCRDCTAAREYYLRALRIKPDLAEAHYNLGNIMREWDRLDEALTCYRNAEKVQPGEPATLVNSGLVLLTLGEITRAEDFLKRALAIDPSNELAHHNLLVAMEYNDRYPPTTVADARREWGNAAAAAAGAPLPFSNTRNPARRLRIGYLSPDFCNHPAAAFLDPMLRHRDTTAFETFCYAQTVHNDWRTDQFRSVADHWTTVEQLSDDDLTSQIRRDGIDLLVDTAGHLGGNRLGVFARRAAPLQISGIGDPGGTGLPTVDYRISDPILDPVPPSGDGPEQPLLIDHGFCCYRPPEEMPPVAPLPLGTNGYLTFGSLHTTARLNETVVARWSDVLRALPTSRMIICRTTLAPSVIARLTPWFEREGIHSDRISFRTTIPPAGHLAVYHDIDLSLDTLPWSGHTTACESLIMGVPVITCAGDRPAGRMVASVLSMAGLDAFIARSDEELIAIALSTAASTKSLATLRATLRQKVLSSKLCDAAAYMKTLESSYRAIWHKWCEGQ